MKKSRVIIIDDESVIREGLQDWLCHDYSVFVFDSAESFLSSLTSFKDETPTCVLLGNLCISQAHEGLVE